MTDKSIPRSFRFDEKGLALLEAGKLRHGSYTAAVLAGLEADAKQGELSDAQLIRLLRERLKR